jgi:hypothetical protein
VKPQSDVHRRGFHGELVEKSWPQRIATQRWIQAAFWFYGLYVLSGEPSRLHRRFAGSRPGSVCGLKQSANVFIFGVYTMVADLQHDAPILR